ncbi:MAG TPA: hypothetical protein VK666_10310 [Chryseolinea sp.]|nr:hypothetical protein [Chryseolinea sp.]
MPLKTLVKVGGLTNLSDARYCAGMGVDMIGFQVIPGQPNYIEPQRFQEIRGWVAGPLIVAEVYGLQTAAELDAVIEQYKPDYLESGVHEIALVKNYPLPYILALNANETLPGEATKPAMVMIAKGQTTIDDIPMMIVVESAEEALSSLVLTNVKGVALKGGPEIKPGLKNYDAIASVLEVLDED